MTAILLIGLSSLTTPPLEAQDLDPGKFADLTLKILTYDRNLTQRVDAGIHIGVVSSSGNAAAAASLLSSFAERQGRKVLGEDFAAQLIDLEVDGQLEESFGAGNLTCVVVFGEAGEKLAAVSTLARQHGVLTVASRKDQVGLLSLGLVAEGAKVKIYRSDAALAAERIQLDATFLNVTRPL